MGDRLPCSVVRLPSRSLASSYLILSHRVVPCRCSNVLNSCLHATFHLRH
jgi:hypothetical protein